MQEESARNFSHLLHPAYNAVRTQGRRAEDVLELSFIISPGQVGSAGIMQLFRCHNLKSWSIRPRHGRNQRRSGVTSRQRNGEELITEGMWREGGRRARTFSNEKFILLREDSESRWNCWKIRWSHRAIDPFSFDFQPTVPIRPVATTVPVSPANVTARPAGRVSDAIRSISKYTSVCPAVPIMARTTSNLRPAFARSTGQGSIARSRVAV